MQPCRFNDGSTGGCGLDLMLGEYRGHRTVGHSGGINGFTTLLEHLPDAQLTVVALANDEGFPTGKAVYTIIRRVLALPDSLGKLRGQALEHADRGEDVTIVDDIAEVIDRLIDPRGPGAAIAVVRGGEVLYRGGAGMANLEWGVPIDTDTVFRIGSITKQFTAAAIMLLSEDGELSLDDEVQAALPDYPRQPQPITIRQVLNHTAGIPSYTSQPSFDAVGQRTDRDLDGLLGLFRDLPLNFEPGERFEYSNSGYALLGAIIEARSGMPYRRFLLERMFRPLGMRRTRYLYDEPVIERRASGYSPSPKGPQNARTMSMTLPHAAGALGSTVDDLLTWQRALSSGKVVSAESYRTMVEPCRFNDGSTGGYGCGLMLAEYRERPTIGHGGGINGFVSMLEHLPTEQLTVIILGNYERLPIGTLTYALVRRALGLPDVERATAGISAAALLSCTGHYRFDMGTLPIVAADDALVLPMPRIGSRSLPFEDGRFFLESDPELTLRFEQLRDGHYQQLTLQSHTRSHEGERVEPPPRQSPIT